MKVICELNPLFVAEHYHEIEEQWMLQDGYGNCHQVEFKKCLTMPILAHNWHEFRDFYYVTLNPLMSFRYLESSRFQIKIFNGSTPKNEYPRFHRLTTCINWDLEFHLTILDEYPTSSKLVWVFFFKCYYITLFLTILIFNTIYIFLDLLSYFYIFQILPPDLGNFLQAKNHEYLRLCGPSNIVTIWKLIFKDDPKTNTKTVLIGNGWKRLCSCNHIRPKTHLEFKCDIVMAKNIVIIMKISRRYYN